MEEITRAYAILENVVDLNTGALHGYRVLSRMRAKSGDEIGFLDIRDKQLRKEIEMAVLKVAVEKKGDVKLFINLPVSVPLESLPLLSKNFVLCLPVDMKLQDMAVTVGFVKKAGLKVALDNFTTVGYETKEVRLGAFDYVFFKEDFYMNVKKSEIKKLIENIKFFGSLVCFKNIDSYKKLEVAQELGADLGHGYFFSFEEIPVIVK